MKGLYARIPKELGEEHRDVNIYPKNCDYPRLTLNAIHCLTGWERSLFDFAGDNAEEICAARLAHSRSLTHPNRSCCDFDSADIMRCYYLFGETLMVSQHPFGQCPWKLL